MRNKFYTLNLKLNHFVLIQFIIKELVSLQPIAGQFLS